MVLHGAWSWTLADPAKLPNLLSHTDIGRTSLEICRDAFVREELRKHSLMGAWKKYCERRLWMGILPVKLCFKSKWKVLVWLLAAEGGGDAVSAAKRRNFEHFLASQWP